MVLAIARRLLVHDLLASPWLVVITFTFLSITMSDVVCIVLFKLIRIDFLAKLFFPELDRFVRSETKTFEVETELQSAKMLEMALVSQRGEKDFHAWREAFALIVIQVLQSDLILIFWS